MSDPAPSRTPPDHLIGSTLANRYQIEERLGEGAMGAVYRAKHVKVGRAFAVKVLHAKLLDDEKVAQRFEREAELAGRLSHANVIGVVDVGETPEGLRYMVMDFAEGEDLAGLLCEAPMTRERIIHLTRQLLEGLFHAHEQGLIHRDFKPENVIIARDDHDKEVPRIVDFGIAILREGGGSPNGEGRLTTNGLVLGTPHYMAPEQAVADPIDHRIDLFALGIVVYEMLCGKLPFDGTGAEVARANLLLDPPPISQRVPFLEVDPLLEAFSRRLMAKKRDHRPPTARDARELLDLIEKDPQAAADFMGVPLAVVSRMPQVTEPVSPRDVTEERDDFDEPAPVVARAPTPLPRAGTPPPVRARTEPPAQRQVPTSMTEPLEFDGAPKNRKKLIAIVAGIALLVVGVIGVIAIKNGGSKAEPEQKIAMVPTPPVPQQVPVEVKPDPPVDKPAVPIPDEPIEMQPEHVVHPPPIKKITPPPQTPGMKVEGVPDKATNVAPSNEVLTALYVQVGRDIKTVQEKKGTDSTSELWRRYRTIQIQDAMASPESKLGAQRELLKLQQAAKK